MKLYNKKRAADGWWRVGLGILWIILAIQERGNWLNWIVSGIFIVGGIWDLVRARTKRLTEEERIELTDERNQMLLLQTKSRVYDRKRFVLCGFHARKQHCIQLLQGNLNKKTLYLRIFSNTASFA